ncbi:MAG: TMEM43 family protein [Proteobacteria bacterium]|nr:TMEM43 family protein [Pseudomonadota bacterium]
MAETVTEVTNQGFFSRLMESIKGVAFGLLLFIIAFPCLFWNEIRAVNAWETLQSGRGAVVSVEAGTVDPGNEGALVHLSGKADTEETLSDVQFGISETAIKLSRDVEMYQWQQNEKKEKRKKVGGGEETVTTYSYEKVWKGTAIDSSSFKEKKGHGNPGAMPYEDEDFAAKRVTVEAFDLSPGLISKITSWEDLDVSAEQLAAAPETLRPQLQVHNGGYYMGANPASPVIGDVRINFDVVRPTVVTVVSGQKNSTLDSWESPRGTGSLSMLSVGNLTSDEMFEAAESSAVMMTWILRIGGFFAMFFGITMIVRPFVVIADIIPFLGSFLRLGSGIIGFFVSAILSLGTIGLGWLFARPILGMLLCTVSVLMFAALAVLAITIGKKKLGASDEPAAA